jgi:phosphoribosylformimino-5-aminoimidazole carboxamide ribotide isomerase
VPFTLLPALDVTDGRLGVYQPEGPSPVEDFEGDPVAAATAFVAAGAGWLHVVDMDLAFSGRARNVRIVRAIAEAVPQARLQASGGITSMGEVEAFLDAGAQRVVIGSAALADPTGAEALLEAVGSRSVIGIEVQDGRIRARGFVDVDLDLMSTLGWLAATGNVRGCLVTSVGRVGGLAGPDTELIRRVARRGLPTLAAGGVRSMADLVALRDAGAVGAVVGRAALDGSLDLAEALAWAAV